jgi:hypothetical protein
MMLIILIKAVLDPSPSLQRSAVISSSSLSCAKFGSQPRPAEDEMKHTRAASRKQPLVDELGDQITVAEEVDTFDPRCALGEGSAGENRVD